MGRMEELQAEIKALQEVERVKAEERQKAKNEAWNALPYEWKVSPYAIVIGSVWCYVKHLFPSYPEGATVDAAYVRRRKSNLDQWRAAWGDIPLHAEKWDGMVYFRTEEGILYHEGGGTYVLLDVLHISE